MFVLLPNSLSLLLRSVYFLFVSQLSLELSFHPHWPSVMTVPLPAHCNKPFMGSEEVVLDDQSVLWGSFSLQGSFIYDPAKQEPEQTKICFSEASAVTRAMLQRILVVGFGFAQSICTARSLTWYVYGSVLVSVLVSTAVCQDLHVELGVALGGVGF